MNFCPMDTTWYFYFPVERYIWKKETLLDPNIRCSDLAVLIMINLTCDYFVLIGVHDYNDHGDQMMFAVLHDTMNKK